MNREIARLLSEAGVTGAFGWQDIVIRQNYAMVPAPLGGADLASMNLGFNLNVLSDGSPAFVAKCRDAGEPELARSTAIRNFLAGDRPDGLSVSPAGIASSKRMTIQVSRFLPGSNLGDVVLRQSSTEFLSLLRTVLCGNATLSRIAMSKPDLLQARPGTFSLATIASFVVDGAARLAALNATEHAALRAAVLATGDMPTRPQHGDFWPPNLLMTEGRIWVLDFDSYGEVCVPLLDDITFMLGTLGWRAKSLAIGVEHFSSEHPEARACQALLLERAEADGLTAAQIEGVIVYYLSHMAFEVHRRSGAVYGAPHIAALRFAAQRLASGRRLHATP